MAGLFSEDEGGGVFHAALSLIARPNELSGLSLSYALEWWTSADLPEGPRRRLFLVLAKAGAVDPKGRPSRWVERPVPRTPLGAEFADLHNAVSRSLKRIEEAAPLLLLSARASGWLRALARPLADLVARSAPKSVLIPYVGEGFAAEGLAELGAVVRGFDRDLEALRAASEFRFLELEEAGDACSAAKAQYDAAFAVDAFFWFFDPVRELKCIRERLKPGGKLFLANAAAESLPSISALYLWAGGIAAYSAGEMEDLLSVAGFIKFKAFSRRVYYAAVWERG